MKIQNTQTNVRFGNQYAVYRKGVERSLKIPLGMGKREVRQMVGAMIQPIATIEGQGPFVFSRCRLSPDKKNITLVGKHITEPSKVATLALGSPVEITLPRNAEPETVRQAALSFLEEEG